MAGTKKIIEVLARKAVSDMNVTGKYDWWECSYDEKTGMLILQLHSGKDFTGKQLESLDAVDTLKYSVNIDMMDSVIVLLEDEYTPERMKNAATSLLSVINEYQ